MVWQYINFPTLAIKKGTFTYSYSNPGIGRNQMMCCCWSQIASDYMKFCFNPLCLVYVPAPSPPPPSPPAPPFFLIPGRLSLPRVHSYTWYTRVSQNNFLRQKYLAFNFWKSFQSSFFLPLCVRTFLQHLLPKMLSFFHHSTTRESFPDFSFITAFFTLA
jgi:hypothetical protein